VVASFGDGTMTKLAALGELGSGWAKNGNIVKIIRYGLFCKGYNGGYSDTGFYDPDITLAVKHMQSDMGLSQSGTLQAKVFKALLNMDAYVLTAGGSDEVRSIQQWLNGRYWTKKTVDIGPADGHYSRSVQQNLMKAIQLEIGIAEADATGNFGAGTQAGIKSKAIVSEGSGSPEIFVQLFSAACVFNQPIVTVNSNGDTIQTKTVFKSNFDSNLATFVTVFQRFSELTANGKGDYATWAQLLVSMGDPDRNVTASDTAYTITPSRAKKMHNDGYLYVGRYLNEASGGGGSKMLEEGVLLGQRVHTRAEGPRPGRAFRVQPGHGHLLRRRLRRHRRGHAAHPGVLPGRRVGPRKQGEAVRARRVRVPERVCRGHQGDLRTLLVRVRHVLGFLRQPGLSPAAELVVQPGQGIQGH
jgi:peptidoglycan hydrolase-like protein with peptidoglycan-binding domain